MSLEQNVYEYALKNELFTCKTLLIAVSGGADSMCLLDICHRLGERRSSSGEKENESILKPYPQICAVHVNHMIRQSQAPEDEELVRSYCRERKIPFFSKTVDVPELAKRSKRGLEETGRDVRRSFFQEIREQYENVGEGPVYTAIAHHREDAAETFMMNLFRGAGPDGLAGMTPKSGQLVRPLLFASKSEILDYLTRFTLNYAIDSTNSDNTYLRNYLRNEIFPRLEHICQKDPAQPVLAAAEMIRRDKEYFDSAVEGLFETYQVKVNTSTGLPCNLLQREHLSISSRLVRRLFVHSFGEMKNFSEVHLSAVMKMVFSAAGGMSVSLPDHRIAYVVDDILFFSTNPAPGDEPSFGQELLAADIQLTDRTSEKELRISFDRNGCVMRSAIPNSSLILETIVVENPAQVVYNSQAWYCAAAELDGAVLRTKRQGDRLFRAGSSGSKPFRRFLTDLKIPLPVRDRILLIARGSDVLWVPGIAHAIGFTNELSHERYVSSSGPEQTQPLSSVLVRVSLVQDISLREDRST